jgi:hypothetical protein
MTASPPAHDGGKWSLNQDTISEIDFHYTALGAVSLRFLRTFAAKEALKRPKRIPSCAT